MQARMKHPALVLPDAMKALHALDAATHHDGLPLVTRKLVHLRASQINGCSVCVDMHARELKQAGTSDERIHAVARSPLALQHGRPSAALRLRSGRPGKPGPYEVGTSGAFMPPRTASSIRTRANRA